MFSTRMAGGKIQKSQMWSSIVLLVIVATLIGVYVIWMNSNTEDTHPVPIVSDTSQQQADAKVLYKTYTSTEHGFRVQYPENWFVEEDTTSAEIFSVQFRDNDRGVTISEMPSSLEGIVKSSMSITEESYIEVSGQPATRLVGVNTKDGGSYVVILLMYGDRLYSISGSGQTVDDVVSYFELI